MNPPAWASLNRLREDLAAGAVSPVDFARRCVEATAEREPEVRAWASFDPDRLLAAAQRLAAAGGPPRPLHGIPVGIKDIFDTADLPTEFGSSLYAGRRPDRDAAAVAELRAAGAVVAGKTVTAEFAYAHPGPTTNPHDPTRTPGGSSSGSAAAVAAGMVPAAIGTQTAGSVVRPAAFCGVVGFKPSFGSISRAGVLTFAESLDTVGVFARTVADASAVAAVLAGCPEWRLADLPPQGGALRLAVYSPPDAGEASAEARAVLADAADRLGTLGASVTQVDLPGHAELVDAHRTVMAFEAGRSFPAELHEHLGEVSPETREILERGRSLPRARYDRATATLERARPVADAALGEVDAVLTLSAPGVAPRGLDHTGSPMFDLLWTALHVPALHLPTATSAEGLPLGIQLVAARGRDRRLLEVAARVAGMLGEPAPASPEVPEASHARA